MDNLQISGERQIKFKESHVATIGILACAILIMVLTRIVAILALVAHRHN